MDIKTLCLAVLFGGDASGYEIKKAFEEGPFSHFQTASFGSIYPSLNRLRDDGMVSERAEAQDGRPDKKVYSLTETGRDAFMRALNSTPGPDQFRSDMLFLLFFAEQIPSERVAGLIEERGADYQRMVDHLDEMCVNDPVPPGRTFVRGFGRAVYAAAADYLRDHKDELLAEITSGDREAAD